MTYMKDKFVDVLRYFWYFNYDKLQDKRKILNNLQPNKLNDLDKSLPKFNHITTKQIYMNSSQKHTWFQFIFLFKIFFAILALMSIVLTLYCIVYTHSSDKFNQFLLIKNSGYLKNSQKNKENPWGIAWLDKIGLKNSKIPDKDDDVEGYIQNQESIEEKEENSIKLLQAFLGIESKQQQLETLLAQSFVKKPEDIYDLSFLHEKNFIENHGKYSHFNFSIPEFLTPPKLLKRINNLINIKKSVANLVKDLQDQKDEKEKEMANLINRVEAYKKSLKTLQDELFLINQKIQEKNYIKNQDLKQDPGDFLKDSDAVGKLTSAILESSILISKSVENPSSPAVLLPSKAGKPHFCTMDSCFNTSRCLALLPHAHLKISVIHGDYSKPYRDVLEYFVSRIPKTFPESAVKGEMRDIDGAFLAKHLASYTHKLKQLFPQTIQQSNLQDINLPCAYLVVLPQEMLSITAPGRGGFDLVLTNKSNQSNQLNRFNQFNQSNQFNRFDQSNQSIDTSRILNSYLKRLPNWNQGSNYIILLVPTITDFLFRPSKTSTLGLPNKDISATPSRNIIFDRALLVGNSHVFDSFEAPEDSLDVNTRRGPMYKYDIVTSLQSLIVASETTSLDHLGSLNSSNSNQLISKDSITTTPQAPYNYHDIALNFPFLLPIQKSRVLTFFDTISMARTITKMTETNKTSNLTSHPFYEFFSKFMSLLHARFPEDYATVPSSTELQELSDTLSSSFSYTDLYLGVLIGNHSINSTFTLFLDDYLFVETMRQLQGSRYPFHLPKTVDLVCAMLGTGSIPIVITGKEDSFSFYRRLPYAEQIDWSRAILTYPVSKVTELPLLLKGHLLPSEPMLFEMMKFGRDLRNRYFFRPHPLTHTLQLLVPADPVEMLERNLRSVLTIFLARLHAPLPPAKLVSRYRYPVPTSKNAVVPPDYIEYLGPNFEYWKEMFGSDTAFRNFSFRTNLTCSLLDKPTAFNDPNKQIGEYHASVPWDPLFPTDAKFHNSNYGFMPINNGYGGSGVEFSKALGGNYPIEKFTIIMLTYKRETFLWSRLSNLLGLPYLDSVIIIWNDLSTDPSPDLELPNIGVPIFIIKAQKNSLNNRFIPYELISTDAILSLDDDLILRHDEIIFAFRVWRESRDRLVGFPARYHAWNDTSKKWEYKSNHTCQFSLILTGAAFLHRYYFYKYTYEMAAPIRDHVDQIMNCEDIAMNFLISHLTKKPPIKVTVRWTFRCYDCPESLWYSGDHYGARSECINYFSAIYGYNPLLYTQYRADSVLFKTRIDKNARKCFKYV